MAEDLPGVGTILGSTLDLEIGDVTRFPSPEHLAQLCRLGAHRACQWRQVLAGPTPRSANHFLKWALVEAANAITTRQKAWAHKHVVQL